MTETPTLRIKYNHALELNTHGHHCSIPKQSTRTQGALLSVSFKG